MSFPASLSRRLVAGVGAGLAAVLLVAGATVAAPPANNYGPTIDALARWEGQTTCDPTEKPGVAAFRALLRQHYPTSNLNGITRACTTGGSSEHKEGRAYDWANDAAKVADRVRVHEVLTWLLSDDCHGNKYAMARRLGVMYIIWDRKIWSAYAPSRGWAPYTGASPHTDHVHFSFSWAGAQQQTSYWTQPSQPSACIVPGTAPTVDGPFVRALYVDLLGREADPAGLHHWSSLLATRQASPRQVAYAFAMTDEYIDHVITGFYRTTLDREPDPVGLEGWRTALRSGMPVEDVAASFYASPEYYTRSGGTDAAWVAALYPALLGRQADPVGLEHWVAATRTSGRVAVVKTFYRSRETLELRVSTLYRELLGREADPAGLGTWPSVVAAEGDFVLASFLASSLEYYTRAQTRYP